MLGAGGNSGRGRPVPGFRRPGHRVMRRSPAPATSCTPGRATPAASRSPRTFVPPIPSTDIIVWGVGGAGWAVGGAPRGAEGAEVENRPPAAPFKMGGLGGQSLLPAG